MANESDSRANEIRGEVNFTLSCQKCGSNELTIPDEATDDSRITCSACGADCGRWGDTQAAINESAIEKFKESLTDAFAKEFDGEDGITFKKAE